MGRAARKSSRNSAKKGFFAEGKSYMQTLSAEESRLLRKTLYDLHFPDIARLENEVEEFLNTLYPDPKDFKREFKRIIRRIQKNEPWEYIRSFADFFGHKFNINKSTLIPRLETEVLVNIALKVVTELNRDDPKSKINIIDVGTGSGIVIISLYKALQIVGLGNSLITFTAVDLSLRALQVALENAHKILGNHNIEFSKSNLLNHAKQKIDRDSKTVIIANLPYLSELEFENADQSVKGFEPKRALVGGKVGDELYKKMFKQVKRHTNKLGLKSRHIRQIWEVSPMIIDGLIEFLHKEDVDAEAIQDQFGIKRFVTFSL